MGPELRLQLPGEAMRLLQSLSDHGLFGSNPEAVAHALLLERLREVVKDGWVGRVGYPDGRTLPLIKS